MFNPRMEQKEEVNQWWVQSRKKELIRATLTLDVLRKVSMKRF
jgi:hypothetical protein